MKQNTLIALAMAGLLSVITGCTNVHEIGSVNGLKLTRVTTRGVFSPSTTTVVLSDPSRPGTIEGPIANAQGPGFLPAVANAAGTAGGAALLRPSKTEVNGGNASATGGTGGHSQSSSTSVASGGAGGNANVVANGGNASGGDTQNGSVHHNTGNGNGSGNNGNGN